MIFTAVPNLSLTQLYGSISLGEDKLLGRWKREYGTLVLGNMKSILLVAALPSPIVSAWSLKNEDLEEINLFSSNSIPALLPEGGYEDSKEKQKEPMIYVGIHQGQLYVQENENLKKQNPGAHQYINNMRQDNGYYLFGDDFDLLLNDSDYWSLKKDEIDSVYSPKTFGEKILYYLNRGSVSLRTWSVIWVPLICVVVGALYVRQYIRTERAINQIRANDMVFSMVVFILHNIFRENQQVLQMLQRLGLHIPTLPAPPTTPMYALTEEGTNETPQTPSTTPSDRVTERQDSCFVSRFTSDFETIGRLGQGGFGVVLRVKKKLDENEYAVKRIVLPSKEKSAERVKREVRALAKLNHSNIVRYYNSWLETPPVDFVQEDDKFWKATDTFAPSFDDFTEQREKIKSEDNQTSGVLSQSINTRNIQDLRIVEQRYKRKERTQSDSVVFMTSSNEDQRDRILSSAINISSNSNSCSHIKNKKRPFSLDIKEFNSSLFNNTDNIKKILENNPPVVNPKTYLFIQMELCKEESLKEWLTANRERDQNWIYSVFNDIVHAVEYVHDRALMHRDLKPSNIFFSLDGEIKIGDFGLVTNIDEENDIALTPLDDKSIISKNLKKQKTLNVGTQLYMSPEQLSGQSYTYKVDIYSLGLIFFEMLVSFSTEMERLDVMRKARDKEFPRDFITKFPDVTNLLKLTLHRDPSKRPTTRGIRLRDPLKVFQKSIENITPEEHFHLIRPRGQGHVRVHSGSQIILQSSSGSP
ncbi:Eukaryotic translation initiation factor 2-alpha kinase [Armadillidium nasatum]|uniref:non-specific serine/threonine protein kinase n=1 Tax=Armadillidium nasatum TaxID=96803 RepID=A0A5N5T2X3_9CRUS|nr:Eukaryotic translation initiation factor 2-alpha kinase [Armadillidium nasatum]